MRTSFVERHQRGALVIMLTIGIILADGILLAPLHEWGHLNWATKVEKMGAEITGWNHTAVEKLTPNVLMSGYEAEIGYALILFTILFFISSPGSINIRKYWFHLGVPLGYATWSWIKPMVFPLSDFVAVPAWTAGMRGTLFSEYVIVIAIAWAMLLIARVRIVNK